MTDNEVGPLLPFCFHEPKDKAPSPAFPGLGCRWDDGRSTGQTLIQQLANER